MRQRDVTKFHFQFAIALFCLLLVFMVGIERNENEIVCTAMSALIHYFTLATVFWMGAEAVLMFQKIIIVFGSITTKYFVIVSLITWCKIFTDTTFVNAYNFAITYLSVPSLKFVLTCNLLPYDGSDPLITYSIAQYLHC